MFRVGYAPDAPNALTKHLLERGFTHKEMVAAGLITSDDAHGAQTKDKFRNRIIFPLPINRGVYALLVDAILAVILLLRNI